MRRFKDWVDKKAKRDFAYNAERAEKRGEMETGRGVFNKRDNTKKRQGRSLEGILGSSPGRADQTKLAHPQVREAAGAKLRRNQDTLNRCTEERFPLRSVLQDVNEDSEKIYRRGTTASEASDRNGVVPRCPDQSITSTIQSEMCSWLRNALLSTPRMQNVTKRHCYLFLDDKSVGRREEERNRGSLASTASGHGQSATTQKTQQRTGYTCHLPASLEIPFLPAEGEWPKNSGARQQMKWLVSKHNATIPCKSSFFLAMFSDDQ